MKMIRQIAVAGAFMLAAVLGTATMAQAQQYPPSAPVVPNAVVIVVPGNQSPPVVGQLLPRTGQPLPRTGSSTMPWARSGIALLFVGGALVVTGRRRYRRRSMSR